MLIRAALESGAGRAASLRSSATSSASRLPTPAPLGSSLSRFSRGLGWPELGRPRPPAPPMAAFPRHSPSLPAPPRSSLASAFIRPAAGGFPNLPRVPRFSRPIASSSASNSDKFQPQRSQSRLSRQNFSDKLGEDDWSVVWPNEDSTELESMAAPSFRPPFPLSNGGYRSSPSRSSPSLPSYPALFSKYSKKVDRPKNRRFSDRAFRDSDESRVGGEEEEEDGGWKGGEREGSKFGDYFKRSGQKNRAESRVQPPKGNPYIAPMDPPMFDFQYSYTETPNVKPIGYREPQYSPFGPSTMSRPWTGGPPMKKSKKNRLPKILPEFDSFVLPTKQKGVKPVEPPGPYAPGDGPKYVRTREEILGEPLTKAESKELIEECIKGNRQVNLGRDGLVHNMLELIHTHWKRKRVCKIKCKGVPTVDMDNVCRQIEDKTGGAIIHRAGGVIYLYRGRNYNYKLRPRFPLMLWKPPAPIYPRLIQDAPEGLTREEANALRIKGRKVKPFCKLGKNGVYIHLVELCRREFAQKDLIKLDCKGLNPSDYKKIGAKLKDLVPCVLLSFEKEQVLMWKGRKEEETLGGGLPTADPKTEASDVPSFTASRDESDLATKNEISDESDADDKSGLILLEDEIQTEEDEVKETLRFWNESALKEREENEKERSAIKGKKRFTPPDEGKPNANYSQSINVAEMNDGEGVELGVDSQTTPSVFSSEEPNAASKYDFDSLWDQAVALGKLVPLDENASEVSSDEPPLSPPTKGEDENEPNETMKKSSDALWNALKKFED